MSTQSRSDPVANTASATKGKKKNRKKKSGSSKTDDVDESPIVNGEKEAQAIEPDDGDAIEEEPDFSSGDTNVKAATSAADFDREERPTQQSPDSASSNPHKTTPAKNGLLGGKSLRTNTGPTDPTERLEAMVQERDELLTEVSRLRKSLEDIQSKHTEEMSSLQEQLEETESGKEQAENQYSTLLEKVNHIKAQLGERLKADAEELSQARSQIEELEDQNRNTLEQRDSFKKEVSTMRLENEKRSREISELRGRANLSQQNWIKERDELVSREAYVREEFENARQAMQDWEVLAMEERSLRESLSERVGELEDQLSMQRESYERAISERDAQSSTVDGLQRALQDIQDARKRELREMVEQSQWQLDELRKRLQGAEETLHSSNAALEASQKELARASPFEKEVKEKNLLIGKLRHEAVILNDHLTKALRFLKQRKPEDMVDRQLVTNHFLHFFALDRSDPKKFQILQLIAALLAWTDEEREQAGLARPGASVNLRVPISPFRRTPSTPSLLSENFLGETGASKESLAELWSDFLEREASEGKEVSQGVDAVDGKGHQSGGLGIN